MLAEPPAIGPRIPFGATLRQMLARGEATTVMEIAPQATLIRPEPFYQEPLEQGVALFPQEFQDPALRTTGTGPIGVVCLEDVAVLGRDGLCVHRDKVVFNSLRSIEPWRRESLIANQNDNGNLILKRAVGAQESIAGPLMLGFVGAWPNYGHWITECLPRAVAFLTLRQHEPETKLLLPPLPDDSPQLATIRRLGIEANATVIIRANDVIHAKRLWMYDGTGIWHPHSFCRTAALHLSVAVPLDQREAEGAWPERLYIQRGMPVRRLVNFDELKPVIDRFGFAVMRMQDLSADDQIRALRNARYVVGENSAGNSNIMFSRRGTRLLELNNPAFVHPAHWALTALIEGGYGYCLGQHADAARPPGMNSDYAIRPDRLACGLEALLGACAVPRSSRSTASARPPAEVARPTPLLDVSLDKEGKGKRYMFSGWAEPDTHGTWSVAPESLIRLPNPQSPAALRCCIRMLPFVRPPYVTEQRVVLSIAGTLVCNETIAEETEIQFEIPPPLKANCGQTIDILVQCPDSIPPIMVGGQPDARFLGVACLRLTLTPLPQEEATAPN